VEQVDTEKLIGELEIAVDRLRSLYEQYFVGIEKLEPQVPRKDVDRKIHTLRKEQIRNTALRFRFQMVLQRYNTYQTHWQRVCREIENGTYKRHLVRAQRRFGSVRPRPGSIRPPSFRPEPGAPLPQDLAAQLAELDKDFAPPSFDIPVDVDEAPPPTQRRPPTSSRPPAGAASRGLPGRSPPPVPPRPAPPRPPPSPLGAARPAAPAQPSAGPRPPGVPPPQPSAGPRPPGVPPPQASAGPRPPGVPSAGPRPPGVPPPRPPLPSTPQGPGPSQDLPDARLRQIYAEYIDARRRRNESTETLTYQHVAKSLRESGDKLRQKHGKPVDFEVAVKDGKTVLRPVLK
jgi:hypothetical protein